MSRRSRTGARGLTGAGLVLAGLAAAGMTAGPAAAAPGTAPVAATTAGSTVAATAAAPTLAPGETASSGMELVANLPKTGAFAPDTAFNSDLAFSDGYAFAGNYNGFTVYDIDDPEEPEEVVQVVCPGSQNDITVLGDLVFLSVDSRRTDDSCSSGSLSSAEASTREANGQSYWEGIRVFDISDVEHPRYVASVETDCGSHTHTLAGVKGGKAYLYVSSYDLSLTTPLSKCAFPHDKISVVEVPLDDPAASKVVAEPVLFPDGGYPGREGGAEQGKRATAGCHDITAYPEKGIAAGACMGEGVLLDIRDVVAPRVTQTVRDTTNFAFWHSATFDDAARKVVFTDELGGGAGATCNPDVGPTKGADAVYDITGAGLQLASYYKISREQASTENCVAHNGSLVPVDDDRDVMVQAWYQGGISVWDFTDSSKPRELAWFDRGPLPPNAEGKQVLGGSWSAYAHDGYVFSNDIQKGLDVLKITAIEVEDDGPDTLNVQSQERLDD